MSCRTFLQAALACLLLPAWAMAQGVLVVQSGDDFAQLPRVVAIWPPMPPRPFPPPVRPPRPEPAGIYRIASLKVDGRLTDQVAQVQVSQTFENTGHQTLEASFIFPLPYDGAVEQMTLMVDGKEFPAKLLSADEARRLYEEIVRRNRDPALLEWLGAGLFKTSVFPIPAGEKRTVTLRYSQLCRNTQGLTDFLFPLSTAKYTSQPVDELSVRIAVESATPIKNIYSPTHAVEIDRPDATRAVVRYKAERETPQADFRLLYDVGAGQLSTRVISYRPTPSEDGYFLLLAAPDLQAAARRAADEADKAAQGKTIVFVIDRSGSMSGKKIEQVRDALSDILNKLNENDLFNIVAYDSNVESFRPELQRFTDENRRAALGFVSGLNAGGSTDIEAALRTALGQLTDSARPSYVIFLTDGLPTAGETNEARIAKSATDNNRAQARIFPFGVGNNVNSRLLDKIARDNFGQSEYVRPNENIEERVASLYRRIQSPVLTNVAITFDLDTATPPDSNANRVYPRGRLDLFAGEQLVLAGRYRAPGKGKIVVRGQLAGKTETFEFPVELVAESRDGTNGFVEKLWAVRRIGELLEELDLKGRNQELIEELVTLSMKHGVLTPYTSFMADDQVDRYDMQANARMAGGRLSDLSIAEGREGVAQRNYKNSLQGQMNAAAAPAAISEMQLFAQDYGGASAAPATSAPAQRGGGGMSNGQAVASPAAAGGQGGRQPQNLAEAAQIEGQLAQQNVRNIANRTFYQRGGAWYDSRLTKEQEAKPQKIKQFSDEYFALAKKYGRELTQYTVFAEPVLLAIDDQVYLIEP